MSALAFQYQRGGIHLPALGLWLDPREPRAAPERVFVSHAHSDHIAGHQEVILSLPTARLMRARLGGNRAEHVLPFGEPRVFGSAGCSWQITLLPAGHILGSAMCLLEAERRTLLYTGDFKLRRGWSAEPCEPRHAELLIMETTYGRADYCFPPAAEVIAGVIRFCREALQNEETPVLLGYSLGKSQELLRALSDAGLPLLLHDQVDRLTRVYEQLGQTFPPYARWGDQPARGRVLLCPPLANLGEALREVGPVRTAVLTGWAVDRNCRFRYGADAAFPLSDHADFPELIEFVQRVAPQRVFTLHGFAAEFAQALRERGFEAQALSEPEQLHLALPLSVVGAERGGRGSSDQWSVPSNHRAANLASAITVALPETPPSVAGAASSTASAFATFAERCTALGSVRPKSEKVRSLAAYLRLLPEPVLVPVVAWLGGLPSAPRRNRVLPLGEARLRDALRAVTGLSAADVRKVYLKHSDMAETAVELLSRRPCPAAGLSVGEVQDLFARLGAAPGPGSQLPHLMDAFTRASPCEARCLVKMLMGDLRIGLQEGALAEALATACGTSVAEVQRALSLLSDFGETARLARRGQLAQATLLPFRPVKFMLASAAENPTVLWERIMNRRPTTAAQAAIPGAEAIAVWAEVSEDGVRCQLHKQQSRVALYSHDLEEVTGVFPELAAAANSLTDDLVLDVMVLAQRGEQALPLAQLRQRLGRPERDLFLNREIPVVLIIVDLLWHEGEMQIDRPWRARRATLETLARSWPAAFRLAQGTSVSSAADIAKALGAAQARGHAGLTIKDPASVYTPGQCSVAWMSLK